MVPGIPIDTVLPNPHQPHAEFEEVALQDLANAIREHRLIQPVVVTPEGRAGFTLLAGEICWRAAQIAELETMLATISITSPTSGVRPPLWP